MNRYKASVINNPDVTNSKTVNTWKPEMNYSIIQVNYGKEIIQKFALLQSDMQYVINIKVPLCSLVKMIIIWVLI